jgi:hypothetical protein
MDRRRGRGRRPVLGSLGPVAPAIGLAVLLIAIRATAQTATAPIAAPATPTPTQWADAQQGNRLPPVADFTEARMPPGVAGPGAAANEIQLGMHGYFQVPMALAWRRRVPTTPGESEYDFHEPRLVDNHYFGGFAYNPLEETDWAEWYALAGNRYATATFSLMGSFFSGPKSVFESKSGLAQGFVTYRWDEALGHDARLRLRVRGGSFSSRLGYIPRYDTYIFGRTRQLGAEVRADVDFGKLTVSALNGFGTHLGDRSANQGLALVDSFWIGGAYDRKIEMGFYRLDSWTQDARALSGAGSADLRIVGADARIAGGPMGELYLAASTIDARRARFIGPSIEVLHSLGGAGLADNFLGDGKSGDGSGTMRSAYFEYGFSLASLLERVAPGPTLLRESDVGWSLFGLYTHVSHARTNGEAAENPDHRKYFKWGTEISWWALSWLGVSVRYDRIAPNVGNDDYTFQVVSPRVTIRTHWLVDDVIYLQWSHYDYGSRVRLPPDQAEVDLVPDSDVFKMEAIANF